MRKQWNVSIAGILCILSIITLNYYFVNKITFSLNRDELGWIRISAIILLNSLFCSLIFLLEIDYYKKALTYLLMFVVIIWFLVLYFNLASLSNRFWDYWEIIIFITFSMISPGVIVYIIHYIKKSTSRFEEFKIFGIYHLHEGFIGIIFIILAIFFLWLRSKLLFLAGPYYSKFSILLLLIQILSFLFLYLGSFFFFRDWNDIVQLHFVEKKENLEKIKKNQSEVFNHITQTDLHFFEYPKITIYPIGILLTIFSLNTIIYGTIFLPLDKININNELVIFLGYFVSFIAAGIIGRDWFRIFRKFYPEAYQEIENIINKVKNEIRAPANSN